MANVIRITAENPDELLNAGAYGAGAIIRLQSGAAEAGPFSNETTAALVAGTRAYTLYDADGISSTWYRTRYENAGGTSFSDWSAAFQVGDETAGYLCSLYDVKQALGIGATTTTDDEILLEYIRQVSQSIEVYTGRWLAPRPSSGTTTYRVHTSGGRSLWVPKGIRSVTTLGVAVEDQPDSGGTYTTATSTDYFIEPPEMERSPGWPGTRITFRRNATGARSSFYDASYGAEITGAFGFASVPPDIQGVAQAAVVRKFIGKETSAPAVAVGPSGAVTILRDIGPDGMRTLDAYRVYTVA